MKLHLKPGCMHSTIGKGGIIIHTVILDSFDTETLMGAALKKVLEQSGEAFSYFKLKDKNILPYRSCGSCGVITPGQCVIRDDMPEIMRSIAPCSQWILLTPIRFGGYSSQLKKVMDKTMQMGLPLYMIKNGHLLHPMRYGSKSLVVMGMAEQNLPDQEENFRLLAERNALNMQFTCKTLICRPSDSPESIRKEITACLER